MSTLANRRILFSNLEFLETRGEVEGRYCQEEMVKLVLEIGMLLDTLLPHDLVGPVVS